MATSQAFASFAVLSRLSPRTFSALHTSSTFNPLPRFSNLLDSPATISIPTISLNLPGLLSDIWEGVLKAVPKKKTSHMKRRHRQLAGKALKDVKSINSCPACGEPKKAHHLCPACVKEIRGEWNEEAKEKERQARAGTY